MGALGDSGSPAAAGAPAALAVLDVLDRDGQPRQTFLVREWPLRVGRSLANDMVLADPHVAAQHFSIAPADTDARADPDAPADLADPDAHDARRLTLQVSGTRNGMQLGAKHLRAEERVALPPHGDALELTAGLTRLRLRLPGHTLAAELPLAATVPLRGRVATMVIAAALLLLGLLLRTWLDTDPDGFSRAAGSMGLGVVVAGGVWSGAWALLSKTFAHQARFSWHLRVFLLGSIAGLLVSALPPLLAFTLSWPWLSDFAFIGTIVVASVALYFHLLAVEPARQRLMKAVAALCAAIGIALTLWFNVQRSDQFGDELYMNHLYPPALRLARPVATDAFVDGLAPLKATLDKKAKDTGRNDDAGGGESEE